MRKQIRIHYDFIDLCENSAGKNEGIRRVLPPI
jgi:hypothetical protein